MISVLAMAAAIPERAIAQKRTSDQIAAEWREAKYQELIAQRDAIEAQISSLDDDEVTPDTRQPPPAVAGAAAAGAHTKDGRSSTAAASKLREAPPTAADIAKAIKALDKKPGGTFGGIDFGGGISFTLDVGTSDRISDAALVNGIVRVNDENNGRARIMLESHYFFTPRANIDFLDLRNTRDEKQWGWGPFIALQPGTDDVIEAVGMGVMFGARRGAGDDSFNLGFGVVVDPNTRILGEGLRANKPLPAGESAIRYKEEMQTGILILSSFSF
ncbi:hypothetical protein VH567_06785 [Sphingomonas sp. 4RDLI-65]|uniref:hypothetical protein n=1 Tax=Sphingomonas sp. 4RDLI-65 TaxID=3111641 RepID=UPI003C29BDBD